MSGADRTKIFALISVVGSAVSAASWTAGSLADEGQGADLPLGPRFVRGDSNDSGVFDISDVIYTARWLFLEGPEPPCMDAADANDDGLVDISDIIRSASYLFLSANAKIPPPGPITLGPDPTPDPRAPGGDLGCLSGS